MNNPKSFGKTYDLDVDALLEEDENPKPKPKAGKAATTGNPMDAEIDGTPFSVLMNQAVKMKTAQQATYREKFDSWPRYYQNSIFASDEVKAARDNPSFEEKMKFAESLKSEANELLNANKLLDANHKYEQALSVFVWAENTDPDWKNKGMQDKTLKEDSFTDFKSEDEKTKVETFLRAVYLNLALCCQKTNEHDIAIRACDEVIMRLDPVNAKALYRRAISRITPASSGAVEMEMAIKDLALANKNHPKDKAIANKLKELRFTMKRQKKVDKKTFTGMFNRGEIYQEDDELRIRDQLEKARLDATKRKIDGEGEVDTVERRIYEAEALYNVYMKQERIKEAEELRKKIDDTKEAKKRMEKAEAAGESVAFEPDFDNPTPQMIKDAKERGIDLTDARVVSMLKKLKEEKKAGKQINAKDARVGLEGTPYEQETKDKLMEMIGDMPCGDLKSALKQMKVDVREGEPDDYYRTAFVQALLDGKKLPDDFRPEPRFGPVVTGMLKFFSGGNTSVFGNFRVAFLFVALSLAWRFISFGKQTRFSERIPIVDEVARDETGVSFAQQGWDEEEF
mmetsp:Transcript_18241/g.37203  ORF Transcript_18241/g.37203 Transcript_18241/m.37203 type:complete len:568 (+) Transcript_18241:142-1845(+)